MAMPQDRQQAARMAIYAAQIESIWDDHFKSNSNAPLPTVPGWNVLGQIRADDDLDFVQSLRSAFNLGQDDCFYGLLLERADADPNVDFNVGDLLVLVRGTGSDKEWLLDALALPEGLKATAKRPGGLVPEGFHSIYSSMVYVDAAGRDLGSVAHALSDVVTSKGKPVTVIGHSLGAALVAYLAYDLATPPVACPNVTSYMFASPNPGDADFASAFKEAVTKYLVVDWSADIVPKVPPVPFVSLINNATPAATQEVVRMTPADLTTGGWAPKDCPTCNHHAVSYARMLNPMNGDAVAATEAYGC